MRWRIQTTFLRRIQSAVESSSRVPRWAPRGWWLEAAPPRGPGRCRRPGGFRISAAAGGAAGNSCPPLTPKPKPSSATPRRKRPPSRPTPATPGSDFMVDVLKKLDFEYVAVNPGSAFEGLHESIINYGQNQMPELLTCLHEEAAAAMAHGYAKAAGKPMMVMVHGTVGLLHSSMAIFQAWADRVPLFLMAAHNRNPATIVNRPHSVQDMGSLVRDYVKFHDEATHAAALRRLRDARLPLCDDAADGAGDAHGRCAAAGSADRRSIAPAGAGAVARGTAAGRRERGEGSRASARRRRESAHRQPEGRADAAGVGPDGGARRAAAGAGGRRRVRFVEGFSVVASAARDGRPRLYAGRDARPRGERHGRCRAQRARERAEDDQHLERAAVPGQQHPRFRPLRGRRSCDRGRCRGDAAAAHRGDSARDDAGAEGRRRGARRARGRRAQARARNGARAGALRVGRQPRSACRA